MRKGLLAALAGAAAMACAGQSGATTFNVDFTVSGDWTIHNATGVTGSPYDVAIGSSLLGNLVYDDSQSGAAAIIDANFTVGSHTFTFADLSFDPHGTFLVNDAISGARGFSLSFFDGDVNDPHASIYLTNLVSIATAFDGVHELDCRNCVTSSLGTDWPWAPDPVPEPSTWALMLLGVGGLGAVLRSRRQKGQFGALHQAPEGL